MNEAHFTYAEAARFLGIPQNTLYSLVAQKRVPHVRLGKRFVRFPRAELERWLQQRTVRPQEAR